VVLFVLLQQIPAHVAILEHLLKLGSKRRPALLHPQLHLNEGKMWRETNHI
jgi:hypothetical protein